MRPLYLMLIPVLLVSASGTQAQTLAPDDPVAVVQVKPMDGPYRLRNEQARQIAGTYEMSNGWSVDVRPDMRHVDVLIDRNRPLRLLAISPRKFVSGDGNVTMEFSRGNDENDMTLRYVPGVGMAEVVLTSVSIAQR
ncbi:hypothetical protein ASD28_08535 [Massilia sp. Root133]|jgi:hypothetical protein|uniref:hypothetical protein n=1 Tax=Massilia TaxID=149698 RepID=UPI0006F5F5D8|nr:MULTISPECIES: hypothetical protein [unclassified Massilia]KQY01538.1 hypothetical protein ASD28_08535 [Massilia sp. Root133]KQZ48204.1 hypothetical protein ASD92_21995 [Massilia sp. Root1485]